MVPRRSTGALGLQGQFVEVKCNVDKPQPSGYYKSTITDSGARRIEYRVPGLMGNKCAHRTVQLV